jgi:hypothetical protein
VGCRENLVSRRERFWVMGDGWERVGRWDQKIRGSGEKLLAVSFWPLALGGWHLLWLVVSG